MQEAKRLRKSQALSFTSNFTNKLKTTSRLPTIKSTLKVK
jgi:hypothetical protein